MLTLAGVGLLTAVWTTVRAGFGVARVWPGIGPAPLRMASLIQASFQGSPPVSWISR